MDSEAHYYIFRYNALRNEYGTLSHYVEELRDVIARAALHEQLSAVQRDELLEIVEKIDVERRALEGEEAFG